MSLLEAEHSFSWRGKEIIMGKLWYLRDEAIPCYKVNEGKNYPVELLYFNYHVWPFLFCFFFLIFHSLWFLCFFCISSLFKHLLTQYSFWILYPFSLSSQGRRCLWFPVIFSCQTYLISEELDSLLNTWYILNGI